MRPRSTTSAASRTIVPASSTVTTVVSWMMVAAGMRGTLALSAAGCPGVLCERFLQRRNDMRRWLVIAALVTTATWLGVAPADSQVPKKGGILKIGLIGEPPTLDGHATTAVITREIGINMFEGLYALDAKFQPVPLLAEGHEVLDGARRYVIKLRSNVKFHNGKPLTSADVVASLQRWGKVASTGKAVFKNVDAVEAKSPTSLEIRLKEPSATLLTVLAQVDSRSEEHTLNSSH